MSDNSAPPLPGPGHFSWNELVTTNVDSAKAFYTQLLGWTTEPFGPEIGNYTVFKKAGQGVGGMMPVPQPGMPAQWVAYVTVEAVDATAAKAARLGGKVMAPPFDVPGVGRIAVLLDPQGAALGIFRPGA